jgi:hypothetical protein
MQQPYVTAQDVASAVLHAAMTGQVAVVRAISQAGTDLNVECSVSFFDGKRILQKFTLLL